MPSENLLSSISAYTALTAILVAILALASTDRCWHALQLLARSARIAVRPAEGICEVRQWSDVKDGPLHVCNYHGGLATMCHEQPHVRGKRCWERSLVTVMNQWENGGKPRMVEKPVDFELSGHFVKVDLKVIIAFLLMATGHGQMYSGRDHSIHELYTLGGVQLILCEVRPRIVKLHIEGIMRRVLTKECVERLPSGFPPLLKDSRQDSIFEAGDEARGGWILALGLERRYKEEKHFLPVYSDVVEFYDKKHGAFWRSIDRVRRIVANVCAPAFAGDPVAARDINVAGGLLHEMCQEQTNSWTEGHIQGPIIQKVNAEERCMIIQLSNGPPLIPEGEYPQFAAEWKPLLGTVLRAALRGVGRCIKYTRGYEERRLEGLLPMELLKTSELYIGGC